MLQDAAEHSRASPHAVGARGAKPCMPVMLAGRKRCRQVCVTPQPPACGCRPWAACARGGGVTHRPKPPEEARVWGWGVGVGGCTVPQWPPKESWITFSELGAKNTVFLASSATSHASPAWSRKVARWPVGNAKMPEERRLSRRPRRPPGVVYMPGSRRGHSILLATSPHALLQGDVCWWTRRQHPSTQSPTLPLPSTDPLQRAACGSCRARRGGKGRPVPQSDHAIVVLCLGGSAFRGAGASQGRQPLEFWCGGGGV